MELEIGGPAGQHGGGDIIKNTSSTEFTKDVIEASASGPVIVDFWSPASGICKQLTPLLEKIVREKGGKVRLVKLNIDQHPAIASQLRVQTVPTVYAFMDGRPLDGFVGAQPENAVRAFVDRLLGGDSEGDEISRALEAAEQAREQNDLQGAAEIYAMILQNDQQNVAAIAGLAQCYLTSGDAERAEQTIALVPPDKQNDSAVQSIRAALDLAKKAGAAGSAGELESKLTANPDDHQARFDLAILLASQGSKSEAVEHLLDLMGRDRSWNDDGARKQLLQFFEAWGPKDGATQDGRRKLSAVLFS